VVRPPLLVRSVVTGRRYLAGLVFMLIGLIPFGFLAAGFANPPPAIILVGLGLIAYGPLSMANTFLGYPRLTLTGNSLSVWTNPFWPTRTDLAPCGQAYAVHNRTRHGLGTALAFRTVADEAAHRAAEKFPFAPEFEEAAKTININSFVGIDMARGEALAAAINAHRGVP
jgi:hypothetical protein